MRKFRLFKKQWLFPLFGGLAGGLYVLLDEGIMDNLNSPPAAIVITHEFLDAVFPVMLGVALGLVGIFIQKQERAHRALSLQAEKTKKEFLLSILISQMLHEIQNPLHNISAAFEGTEGVLTEEKYEIVKRNLGRLSELKKRYGGWDWAMRLDTENRLDLKSWLEALIDNKASLQFEELGVHFTQKTEGTTLFVHPVLMEQILLTLIENALEAMKKSSKKELRIEVAALPGKGKQISLKISNTGNPFPEPVLASQGWKPAESRHGLGLGLLLLNKILEQIGGKMSLSNDANTSVVSLSLPGELA